jgi:nucleoid DNA-binding protein
MSYKKDIAREVSSTLRVNRLKTSLMMSKTFEYISEILAKEGRVELRNCGVFEVVTRKPRVSRNPKTGEVFHVPKRYKVRFKPSKKMMDSIIGEAFKKIEILHQIKNIGIK